MVLGCKMLDPDLNIAGVILNHYAGPRHKRVTTQAIEQITGIPVVGAIPKLDVDLIPNRHLGLKTLVEHDHTERVKDELLRVVNDYLDMDKIIEIAKSAPAINLAQGNFERKTLDGAGLNIGVVSDEAFSFYYAENIEALEDAGAKIVRISATAAQPLPENIDALFIGGGFPEMHLEKICANRRLLNQVKEAADNGLPIYAECGGLMFLSKSIQFQGANYPMAGVFPVELGVSKKPKGHGYCEVNVDRENPFFKTGTLLRGHEFHYSYIHPNTASGETAFEVKRGTGCFDKRDGLIYKNAMASYLHLHAIGSPEWAKGLMSAAQEYRHTQIGHRAGTISFDHRHASGQG
jgi:cobyrinic acid a,c-diamide synthase